jgi:hypothetical protein
MLSLSRLSGLLSVADAQRHVAPVSALAAAVGGAAEVEMKPL